MHTVVHKKGDLLGMHGLRGQHEGAVQTEIHELLDGVHRGLGAVALGSLPGIFEIAGHDADKLDILGLGEDGQIVILGNVTDPDHADSEFIHCFFLLIFRFILFGKNLFGL